MQRAQFVKVLSSSQELTNLSSRLPGEVEKDYLQFIVVEAKHRRIKLLVSGHIQGTQAAGALDDLEQKQKKVVLWVSLLRKWPHELLHFPAFYKVGENTFLVPLPTESFGKVLVNSRAPDLSVKESNGADISH